MSGEEYPTATGGGCLLLYVRGAGVAAGGGDCDAVEAESSMEERYHSGIGEHAAGGVPDRGDPAEDDGGDGVPAAVVDGEAATGDGVAAEAGGGGEAATAGEVPVAAGGTPVGPSGGGT